MCDYAPTQCKIDLRSSEMKQAIEASLPRACAEDVGEGGACGDSAGGVDCKSDLWCSKHKYKLANIKTKYGDATKQNRCQKSFWKSSIFADTEDAIMVIAIAVSVIATGGAAAVAEGAIEGGAEVVGAIEVDSAADGVVSEGVSVSDGELTAEQQEKWSNYKLLRQFRIDKLGVTRI
jgi:hypothetical protein